MRQVAWLNAIVEKKDKSRLESIREAGDELPPLPHNPAPYLTDWLFEIGPVSGDDLIGWRDFVAWQAITGVEMLPLEAKILRRLSGEYAAERYAAKAHDRPMPYNMALDEVKTRREGVEGKIRALFSRN